MIHLPSGLTITSISPRTVRVAFDRRVEKLVEVSPQLAGRPQHGYVVAEVEGGAGDDQGPRRREHADRAVLGPHARGVGRGAGRERSSPRPRSCRPTASRLVGSPQVACR